MVSRNLLLEKLPPFMNNRKVIMQNQNVGDIINGIINTHEQYKSQYDKISPFFLGSDLESTCYNVWSFLKQNVPYRIESDDQQTLRAPASIVSGLPADCKTFSLFSMGIADSLRRKGLIDCKLAFRFAGYNDFSNNLEHVFCVINPKTKNEIWCDAVLPNFNQKKQPSIYKDKNINMALVALSGIGDFASTANNLANTAASLSNPVSAGLQAIKTLSDLFKNKPNPTDWVGWDALDQQIGAPTGTNVLNWVINDGDDVKNEALNIVSYILSKGFKNLIGYSTWFKRNITIDDIVNKLNRGGFSDEAAALKAKYNANINVLPDGTILPTEASKTAGMNIWVTVALVGAAIFAITSLKKGSTTKI